jgi:hypothetical protein
MTERSKEEVYRSFWEALRSRVCSVCLDGTDDGSCGLSRNQRSQRGQSCVIERDLPRIVDTILAVRSGRMDEYVAAVEAQICGRCSEQDARGLCRLRQKGECSLSTYLPLIVDAIEEVNGPTQSLPTRP